MPLTTGCYVALQFSAKKQREDDAVVEGAIDGVDDIICNAHSRPIVDAIEAINHYLDGRFGAVFLVQYSYLVIYLPQLTEIGVRLTERFAQRHYAPVRHLPTYPVRRQ